MIDGRRVARALAFVAASLPATLAQAQLENGPEDAGTEVRRAEALKLFDQGRALMQDAGKLDQACGTLTQSYDLYKRGDTLLNLAECHRRQGKTATAWREFDEAIRYAKEVEFDEAISTAAKLRDELAKTLSQLVVEVPSAASPPKGLVVVLDGKTLPKEQWGQQLFVDPGVHAVTATAEGYKPFSRTTEVHDDSDRAVLKVELEKIPEASKPAPAPPAKPAPKPVTESKGHVPIWSVVVGSAGVAMMGVSIGFGVDTVGVGGELDDQCGAERKHCPSTYDFRSARSEELRSYGLFVGLGSAGIAATAAGVIGLVVGVTTKSKSPVAFAPWGSPDGAGLMVSGVLPSWRVQ